MCSADRIYLMLPANLHPRRSFRCYRTRLRTGCRPCTGLSPIFCLSPPQTSPVTPIVEFSYRVSRNIAWVIAFRPGTGLEHFFCFRPFLLRRKIQNVSDHFPNFKFVRQICGGAAQKKIIKISSATLTLSLSDVNE